MREDTLLIMPNGIISVRNGNEPEREACNA